MSIDNVIHRIEFGVKQHKKGTIIDLPDAMLASTSVKASTDKLCSEITV